MYSDTYSIKREDGKIIGCVDLVESPDDHGWYAQQYDFTRKDSATRTSSKIYSNRRSLMDALDGGKHRWQKWS